MSPLIERTYTQFTPTLVLVLVLIFAPAAISVSHSFAVRVVYWYQCTQNDNVYSDGRINEKNARE